MATVRPDRETVNEPVPLPEAFLFEEVVGFWLVLQTTPHSVTDEPPSEVTLPPTVAPLDVTLVAEEVVTVGATALVVKLFCSP